MVPHLLKSMSHHIMVSERVILAITCGTHLGETKEVASIFVSPESARRAMNSSLTWVGTWIFSFWRPSRGPTSTILTEGGRPRQKLWVLKFRNATAQDFMFVYIIFKELRTTLYFKCKMSQNCAQNAKMQRRCACDKMMLGESPLPIISTCCS